MSSEPRLNLTPALLDQLKELAAQRRERGVNCTPSSLGQEILSEWLPAYRKREQAIKDGTGPCLPQTVPDPPQARSMPSTAPTPSPLPSKSGGGAREKFSKFLNS